MSAPQRNKRDGGNARARKAARAGWQERFLEAFRVTGIVSSSAEAAGVHRSSVYRELEKDEAFVAAFEDAEAEAVDVLEREALRRAVEGVVEPVVSAGEHVTDVRRYSDRLLEFLLKARRPDRFSERHRIEHRGAVEVGLTLTQLVELAGKADEEGDGKEKK